MAVIYTGKNHKLHLITIREYILKWKAIIDLNADSQRLRIESVLDGKSKETKAQGIIRRILNGDPMPDIQICKNPEGSQFTYDSMDGGHRCDYSFKYYENWFRNFETEQYYSELSEKQREDFLNYTFILTEYGELTEDERKKHATDVNKTQPFNFAEEMNAFGKAPLAVEIRETSRPHRRNNSHKLFEVDTDNGRRRKYKYLDIDDNRLKHQHFVMRTFAQLNNGGLSGTCTDDDIREMHDNRESIDVNELTKKCHALYDKVVQFGDASRIHRRKGLDLKRANLFQRIVLDLDSEYNYVINDYEKLFIECEKVYMEAYNNRGNKSTHEYWSQTSPFDTTKNYASQFIDSLTEYDTIEHIRFAVDIVKRKAKVLDFITIRDKSRSLSNDEKWGILLEQNNTCAIDGLPLTMEEAEAAHIDPYAEGGATTRENTLIVRREHNRKMGTMNALQYKELYTS